MGAGGGGGGRCRRRLVMNCVPAHIIFCVLMGGADIERLLGTTSAMCLFRPADTVPYAYCESIMLVLVLVVVYLVLYSYRY